MQRGAPSPDGRWAADWVAGRRTDAGDCSPSETCTLAREFRRSRFVPGWSSGPGGPSFGGGGGVALAKGAGGSPKRKGIKGASRRKRWPEGLGRLVLTGGGGVLGPKGVRQQWPHQIFPIVNFAFFPKWSLWSFGGGGTRDALEGGEVPPGGSLCCCTCAQEAISANAGRKWLVGGLKDHRYLSVTKSATRRQPAGGTPTSKQQPRSGTQPAAPAKHALLHLPYNAIEFMYVEIFTQPMPSHCPPAANFQPQRHL